jgi:hypothetical protein
MLRYDLLRVCGEVAIPPEWFIFPGRNTQAAVYESSRDTNALPTTLFDIGIS